MMESDRWYITDIHTANKRIKKLETENERLELNYDHYESFDEGFKAGMKRIAEIADEYSGVHYKIDELINRIRAEIEGKE